MGNYGEFARIVGVRVGVSGYKSRLLGRQLAQLFQQRHEFFRLVHAKNPLDYYHHAHSKSKPPDEHINDNGGGLLRVGKHFTNLGFIDTLSLSVDGLASYNRIRNVSSWHTPIGAEASIRMILWKFGSAVNYYRGLYKDESDWHRIKWGNSFYSAKKFAQFDVYFFPLQSKYVTSEFILSFYIVERELDTRQKFLLTMSFERFSKCKRKR